MTGAEANQRRSMKSILIALGLALMGTATCLFSQPLMFILIHFVGEERALGPYAVRRLPDGTVLMTNPMAMTLWMLPIWALGLALIALGVWVWRRNRRSSSTP